MREFYDVVQQELSTHEIEAAVVVITRHCPVAG